MGMRIRAAAAAAQALLAPMPQAAQMDRLAQAAQEPQAALQARASRMLAVVAVASMSDLEPQALAALEVEATEERVSMPLPAAQILEAAAVLLVAQIRQAATAAPASSLCATSARSAPRAARSPAQADTRFTPSRAAARSVSLRSPTKPSTSSLRVVAVAVHTAAAALADIAQMSVALRSSCRADRRTPLLLVLEEHHRLQTPVQEIPALIQSLRPYSLLAVVVEEVTVLGKQQVTEVPVVVVAL